jgi:hypothetical protein
LQQCLDWLGLSKSAKDPGSVSFYTRDGAFGGKIEGDAYFLSEGETVVASLRPDGQLYIYDLPMRWPIEWQLLLSAPPALLLTLLLRWRLGARGV